MALSRRGTHSKEIPGEMLAFACRYVHNPYDEHTNPKVSTHNEKIASDNFCNCILFSVITLKLVLTIFF